jgi:hypothetical protein
VEQKKKSKYPVLTQSQILGNQGEAYVASILSPKCLVRSVGQGADIGIDFYCEWLVDDSDKDNSNKKYRPSLHFLCPKGEIESD